MTQITLNQNHVRLSHKRKETRLDTVAFEIKLSLYDNKKSQTIINKKSQNPCTKSACIQLLFTSPICPDFMLVRADQTAPQIFSGAVVGACLVKYWQAWTPSALLSQLEQETRVSELPPFVRQTHVTRASLQYTTLYFLFFMKCALNVIP